MRGRANSNELAATSVRALLLCKWAVCDAVGSSYVSLCWQAVISLRLGNQSARAERLQELLALLPRCVLLWAI